MEIETDASEREKLEIFQRCRNSCWEFSKYIRTIDESDRKSPIKAFPYNLAYVKLTFAIMEKEKLILIPKSRRMKMTWCTIVFILWDTMFHKGVHSACCSKKEDDADWLLRERIKFVYDNLDPSFPKEFLPRMEYKYCLISFPEIHSKIQGFPQGADQLRMYTLSNIFGDELAFWEKTEDTFAGAKPTLEGGGRFIGVSSAAPGYFKKMVFDTVDNYNRDSVSEDASKLKNVKVPMQGIRFWRNEKNKYCVLEIHYTADPNKRSAKFKEDAKAGMSHRKYMQEYEIVWDTFEGEPVYTDFSKTLHTTDETLYPHLGLPILRGWDFGLTPSCIIAQLQEEKLVVLKEYVAYNMGIERFLDIVLPDLAILFPQWSQADYVDYVDASGFNRKDTDEKTCAGVMRDKGLKPIPGEENWEKRRSSVEYWLKKIVKGEPAFLVSAPNCQVLTDGFMGGYKYPPKVFEKEPNQIRPLKDEYSHPHDGLQMITSKINIINKRGKSVPIPSVKYNQNMFGKKSLRLKYGFR